ncbi:MAG TPA: hydroxysqualene dehydroxylase HpnE [Acidobacteriaceae bacterium]
MSKGPAREIVVVGAGVAGLSAAEALARAGEKVTLLERRPMIGGRAYSYLHPALNEVVDSQHVVVGCCSNLIELTNAAGLADKVRWYDKQNWLEPTTAARGPRNTIIEIGALPAPMQFAGSFLRAPMLEMADRLAVARGLMEFRNGAEGDDTESVAQWYQRTRQTERAVRHLWEPLVLATLNDSSDRCSMKYAAKVFYELFLKNKTGGRLGIPTLPLSEFYGAVAERVCALGGRVELRAGVEQIARQTDGRWLLRAGEREGQHEFWADDVVLALPFEQTQRLVGSMTLGGDAGAAAHESARRELLAKMARFDHSPYISVLLWFDREITELDHAWLLDSPVHWFFHKSRIRGSGGPSYVEVVISGSREDLLKPREALLAMATSELARFFPEVARAKVVKSGVLKEARATFTLPPGEDDARPAQKTAILGLYLAGDWTATGWPSTMESACRSGRLAAGAATGDTARFMAKEPEATGLARFLAAR